MALNSAIKHHIPSVLTMHGMYALNPNVLGGKSWLEELFNKYIFKKVLFRTSAVIGLTKQITDYARLYSGQHVKFFTIPNGVNVSTYKENIARKFQYRQKYNIDARSKVIIFVGRFEKVKGILEFVSAIKLIYGKGSNQIETIIVGEGGLEREVNSMVSGTAGIHLFGWQTSQIIHEFYLAADIFVIPSKFEALPLTIIEAMNAHLHIVYTPVGGIPDVLEKYEAKTLLDEPSVERIATVLSSLLGNHPSDEHDANSFIYAEEFDWKNIADNVNLVYQELCKS
jgi:glycosyltransferase involved in cell wall biosynthesis